MNSAYYPTKIITDWEDPLGLYEVYADIATQIMETWKRTDEERMEAYLECEESQE